MNELGRRNVHSTPVSRTSVSDWVMYRVIAWLMSPEPAGPPDSCTMYRPPAARTTSATPGYPGIKNTRSAAHGLLQRARITEISGDDLDAVGHLGLRWVADDRPHGGAAA